MKVGRIKPNRCFPEEGLGGDRSKRTQLTRQRDNLALLLIYLQFETPKV